MALDGIMTYILCLILRMQLEGAIQQKESFELL